MRRVSLMLLAVGALLLAACTDAGDESSASEPTTVNASSATSSVPVAPTLASAKSLNVADLTGRILFTRAGGQYGDETLFSSNIDGTDELRISELGAGCCPWAMPDGSHVVFSTTSSDGRITTIVQNFDESDRVELPLPDGTLNLATGPLSPDGTLVAREGFDDARTEAAGIYVTAIDGSNLRRVTQQHFIPGDFSPDGTQLVLFNNAEGDPPPSGSLWTVNLDGSGLRQLTADGTKVKCCTNYRWSPDGSKILFADEDGVLWTIAPDGSNLSRVFKGTADQYAITPTWSPDGSMVLFAIDPVANPFGHPINALYVIRADGSGLAQVVATDDFKREPVWVTG